MLVVHTHDYLRPKKAEKYILEERHPPKNKDRNKQDVRLGLSSEGFPSLKSSKSRKTEYEQIIMFTLIISFLKKRWIWFSEIRERDGASLEKNMY